VCAIVPATMAIMTPGSSSPQVPHRAAIHLILPFRILPSVGQILVLEYRSFAPRYRQATSRIAEPNNYGCRVSKEALMTTTHFMDSDPAPAFSSLTPAGGPATKGIRTSNRIDNLLFRCRTL